jgi:RND superfamily putative drug exporter
MSSLLRGLATATTRHPRRAIAALLVLLIAITAVGVSAGGPTVDDFDVPGIESQKAQDLIAERFPDQGGDSATVVLSADGDLRSSARAAAIGTALDRIEAQPHVSAVDDPLADGRIAPDGRTAFATVTYDTTADELKADPRERLEQATAPLERAGVEVAMAGPIVDAGNEGAMPVGELAGVVVALLLLLLVLRSVRAALSSLLTAFVGLALGFGLMGLAANGVEIPSLAPTMAAMLGLGAGIDYALLSAARHQEELRRGRTPAEAAAIANATAGHSAVTAAAIVLISISGLLVTGIPFVGKVGVVAGGFVLVTSLVAVLLLPPLFAAAGRRMLPRRERGIAPETLAERVAADDPAPAKPGFAVGRPKAALLLGAVIAVALAIPATGLELGQPDNGNLPTSETQRVAYDRLAAAFGPGFNGPLVVAVDARGSGDAAAAGDAVRRAVADDPGVASATPPVVDERGDTALVTVFPTSSPQDAATADLVRSLRDTTIPAALEDTDARALVGGYNARLVDEAQRISDRLPIFALVVVGLSLLLLTATFRSLKVAVLSAVLNLVAIAAAYGVIHLLFQTEAGTSLIGVEIQPVVPYVPLFMFAILFGLSTDYNVFLLSRVREEWQRLGHVPPAVAEATARTRRVISAAGAIMIAVFLGFATDADTTMKMSGFGLASAILVDITLVRLLLAPAALTLLGDRIWKAPRDDRRRPTMPSSPGAGDERPASVAR